MNKNQGMVYLVGAGPGDPGLITVKGLDCIKKADLIIYDRLACARLTAFAHPEAELVYVGKSPEQHSLKQVEINRLLVEKAAKGKTVTRLKGGDPFVFGRGGEEAEALWQAGIPFEVVPGITSAIAAPAYAGIPVTHRDYTSVVAIITGNEDPLKENSAIPWEKLSTGAGTLVFLMGMANLNKITERLIANGRHPQTPVALVRWGTRPEQRTLVGTLEDISLKADQSAFANPAVIIVGEVVSLREKLNWFEKKPLFGKRVLVTRSSEQAGTLSAAIGALGGESLEFPTISVAEPEDYTSLDNAIKNLHDFSVIIFTSVNGVKSFFKRLRHQGKDIREMGSARICAIGPKTKGELENSGLLVDYVPEEYRAEKVIEELRGKVGPGTKVLLPRADIARKVLPDALAAMGADVSEVTAYRTAMGGGDAPVLKEMFKHKEIDMVTFTSSSTVRNFIKMLDTTGLKDLLKDVTVACIGPITAGTARDMGLNVDVVADNYTIEGLIEAVLKFYGWENK